jgi:hypothetical protein
MILKPLLDQLSSVTDDELRRALQEEHLSITADKYTTAFSCIAVAYKLRAFDFAVRTEPPDITEESLLQNRQRASIVFLAFTALQYMRSEHLERGLDHVKEESPLRPFRDIFRSGCARHGEDTFAQHIRNSLAHGTFEFVQQKLEVMFVDRDWTAVVSFDDLWDLCRHVHRLYHIAFFLADRSTSVEMQQL